MEKGGTHSLCKVFPTPPPEAGGNGIISQTFVFLIPSQAQFPGHWVRLFQEDENPTFKKCCNEAHRFRKSLIKCVLCMVPVKWEFFSFSALDAGSRGLGLRGGLLIAAKHLTLRGNLSTLENKEGLNAGWWL